MIWLPICICHAARIDAGKCRGKTIKRKRLAVGNAELVLGLAGGDLVMGLRVDVGIDAERDACREPERRCRLAQSTKLGLQLDVEGEDALF